MKIQAFNWQIEVTEDYVKVNGQIVAPQDQATDCDGTPLNYGDEMVCIKDFTDYDGTHWWVGEKVWHTTYELKNFRKVN